jgi:hypothetical protein
VTFVSRLISSEQARAEPLALRRGITLEEAMRLLAVESCAICGTNLDDSIRQIDHCHVTGKVRDALCRRCNVTLGMVREDLDFMKKLADYIIKHRSES